MVITFDFDETLTESEFHTSYALWVSSLNPNKAIVDKFRAYQELGDEVHIVTFRSADGIQEIDEFLVANNLKPVKIHATGGKPKKTIICDLLKSSIHFDDDIATCLSLHGTCCTPILMMNEYNKVNSSASLINEKIYKTPEEV